MAQCKIKSNFDIPSCPDKWGQTAYLLLVPEKDSTGAKNRFSSLANVTLANLLVKLADADENDRFYLIPTRFENTNEVPEANIFETFESKATNYVRDGITPFEGILPRVAAGFVDKINSWNGQKFGVYRFDLKGNFNYMAGLDGTVEPIPVDGGSINAQFIPMKGDTGSHVMVKFNYSPDAYKPGKLRTIAAEDLDFTVSDLTNLVTVVVEYPVNDTDNATLLLTDEYGNPIEGILTGNVACYNVTDAGTVSLTGWDETAEGQYECTYTAQTVGDVLRFTITLAGYDFAKVTEKTMTVENIS